MGTAAVFNKLAEKVMPKIADAVFPDVLKIIRSTTASDGKGGQKTTAAAEVNYYPIPCAVEAKNRSVKDIVADKWVAVSGYLVKFPCIVDGGRADVNVNDRIEIEPRGLAPLRKLKIESLTDNAGIYFEAFCRELQ